MSKEPVEFRRETELLIVRNAIGPRFCSGRGWRAIEAAVDLDRVEEIGEIFERIRG